MCWGIFLVFSETALSSSSQSATCSNEQLMRRKPEDQTLSGTASLRRQGIENPASLGCFQPCWGFWVRWSRAQGGWQLGIDELGDIMIAQMCLATEDKIKVKPPVRSSPSCCKQAIALSRKLTG